MRRNAIKSACASTSPDVLRLDAGLESAAILRKFLKDWHPPIALIFAEVSEPDLVLQLRQMGATVLVYAPETGADSLGFPSSNRLVLRGLMRQVSSVLAGTEAFARRLQEAGLPAQQSLVSGTLPTRQAPRPVDSIATQSVATQLAGRPSWLATDICREEEDLILSAYESTAQRAHRSLLVVQLSDAEQANAFREKARAQGRQVVLRSETDQILAETQIVVADKPEEEALWYRIAPLTFVGQTLRGSGGCSDPMIPASLGSAILHGPRTGQYQDSYQALDRAGAAKMVRDLDQLSRVLIELQAADKVAEMAHAAWDLSTKSAEATAVVADAVLAGVTERKAA